MGDWIELKGGEIVDRSYDTQTGMYHSASLVRSLLNTADRRGKAIEVLRAALPKGSPLRDMSTSDLSKVRLKESASPMGWSSPVPALVCACLGER